MNNLTIGSSVLVSKIAEVDYIGSDRQVIVYEVEPLLAKVTGQRRKYVGTYQPEYGHIANWSEEWDPAYLNIKGSVLLWEVRYGLQNKPVLVRDQDLERTTDFVLPTRIPNPIRKDEGLPIPIPVKAC